MSTQLLDSTRRLTASAEMLLPRSVCALDTSSWTCEVGRCCHWLVWLSNQYHFEGPGTLRNSSTVGLRLPRVPEMKLNCSPASDSMSLLFPTDCPPMRMN